VPITGAKIEAPKPPRGLLKRSQEAWAALWASPMAAALDEADMPAIRRWITYVDEHERVTRALADTGLVTEGSMGQLRLSPLADRQMKLAKAIGDLEAQLGVTPLARLRLGLLHGRAALTAQELNRITREQMQADAHETAGQEWAEGFTPAEDVTQEEGNP
jgi:P27 family predicted phage terminase small subunit